VTYFEPLPAAFPYILALVGIAGLIAIGRAWATTDDRDRLLRLWGTCLLWQLLPTTAWLFSFWSSQTLDGPSSFFRIVEATAVVLVPIAAGLVHRSWRIALITLSLPFIAFGLMMAALIFIMGSGR
jgi:hypothetical protein